MNWWKLAFRLFGLIVICIVLIRADFALIAKSFANVNIPLILLAFGLNIPQIFFKSMRWKNLLEVRGIAITHYESFGLYMQGVFLGIITPGRFGEISRAYFLKELKGVSVSLSITSVIFDRIFDLMLLFIIAGFALALINPFGKDVESLLFTITSVAALGLFAGIIFLTTKKSGRLVTMAVKKIEDSSIVKKNFIANCISGLHGLSFVNLMHAILMTLISYCIYFLQCFLLFASLGISVEYLKTVMIMAIVNIISFIPISFSGIGTRDVALIFLFRNENVLTEMLIAYSTLVLVVFYFGAVLIGSYFWFFDRSKGSLPNEL